MMPDMNDPEDNVPGNLQKLNDIYQKGLELGGVMNYVSWLQKIIFILPIGFN